MFSKSMESQLSNALSSIEKKFRTFIVLYDFSFLPLQWVSRTSCKSETQKNISTIPPPQLVKRVLFQPVYESSTVVRERKCDPYSLEGDDFPQSDQYFETIFSIYIFDNSEVF